MSARTGTNRLRLALVLGALSAFGPITTDLYLPSLPEAASDLHASQPQIQVTLTTCLVGLALGQLFIGPLSDAVGRRRPMLGGVAVFVVASLLCALAPTVYLLDAFRLIQGLAGSAGVVLSLAIVRDLYSGVDAAKLISSLMAVGGIAPILAPVAGAQLLRVMDWRGLFYVLAGTGVVLLGAAWRWIPESLPAARRAELRLNHLAEAVGTLSRDPRFVCLSIAGAFAFATLFSYISTSPFVFQDGYGFTEAQFGILFAANSAGLLCVNLAGGRLLGRVSPTATLRVALAAMTAACVAMLVASVTLGMWGVIVCLFLSVMWVPLTLATLAALALDDHGDVAGTASALLGALRFAVGGIAGAVAGLGGADPTALAVAMLACSVVAVVAFLIARRTGS
ncbi:multidrug effflux MFS transporter [Tsukamurella sp. 8F]|uniref:multidrug effflux MFS transporter n=1 Tax=unclassified Tsukamurella TaxID=2633480 RepID=UPI0023B9FE47|nr:MULTISPECIES: multidrug effflux MFS transporter [unclassified Tsukamurella]MDF0528928.1 multidrug effflux MFS transporter [Tsukamurella sp. 8J]MDF0589467.1 multidrug effflux MFS transporter [Tsukamurella sp. 8F]